MNEMFFFFNEVLILSVHNYTEDDRKSVEKVCCIADKRAESQIHIATAELLLNICNSCLQRHSKRPTAKEVNVYTIHF